MNIELHQTFAAHFQKEGLADFLIHDIGAFHDLVDFERLLAEHIQDSRRHCEARTSDSQVGALV